MACRDADRLGSRPSVTSSGSAPETGAAAVAIDGVRLVVTRTADTRSCGELIAFAGATYVATWEGGIKSSARTAR